MKFKLTFVFLLLVSFAHAQKWHFGPKLDLNLAQLDGKGMQSSFTPGIQIGGFAQHIFNKKWSIQPELMYTLDNVKKGDDFLVYYNNNIGRSNARTNIRLDKVSVPVLVRYEIFEKLSVMAGPQFSYLLNTNEDLVKSGADAFSKSEFSINAGLQFNLGGFGLSVRYNKGLNDINDIDNRYKWTTNHIQIGAAVRIK